jgi:hypothetical protein
LDEQFEEDDEKGFSFAIVLPFEDWMCFLGIFYGLCRMVSLLQHIEHNDTRFRRCGIVGVLTEKSPACHDSIWYGKVREKAIVTIV